MEKHSSEALALQAQAEAAKQKITEEQWLLIHHSSGPEYVGLALQIRPFMVGDGHIELDRYVHTAKPIATYEEHYGFLLDLYTGLAKCESQQQYYDLLRLLIAKYITTKENHHEPAV